MDKIPSEKQIELADHIAKVLNIDFPQSSVEFTAQTYWEFIKNNIKEAKSYWTECESDEFLYDMDWLSPLNQ